MRQRRIPAMVLLVTLSALLTGCGKTPATVGRAFFRAYLEGDQSKARQLITKESEGTMYSGIQKYMLSKGYGKNSLQRIRSIKVELDELDERTFTARASAETSYFVPAAPKKARGGIMVYTSSDGKWVDSKGGPQMDFRIVKTDAGKWLVSLKSE